MKIKTYKHGYAIIERIMPSGMYIVKVRGDNGYSDTIRCDDRKTAHEYFKAFCAIAKVI